MLFAIKLYRIQAEANKSFIHEHPASAKRCQLPEMQALMYDLHNEDQYSCVRIWNEGDDEVGVGLVKKPPGFSTNSDHVKEQLSKKCMGAHRLVQLKRRQGKSVSGVF